MRSMQGSSIVRASCLRVWQATALWLALLVASPAPSAETAWRTLEAEHFRVLSQLGDRDTIAWARDFNQFIASMSGVLHIDPRRLPPLTIVLFARNRDFIPFMTVRPNGKTANISGLTARQPTWSVIAIGPNPDRKGLRSTVYHEATHWLMSADEARRPAWYAEGTAVLFSTFEQVGRKVNLGKPPESRLQILDEQGMTPMREFLIRPGALFNHDDDTAQFYAQSWVFTHFLLYSGEPARVQLLNRFLEVYRTRSGEATVNEVIGTRLAALDKDFRNYASRETYEYSAIDAASIADPPPPVPASPAFIQSTLAFLAFGGGRFDLARQYAGKAIELAPYEPGGHEILAYLAVRDQAHDRVKIHAEAALRSGSRDSQMYMLLGQTFAEGANASQPGSLRQRIDLYERAIRLNPWRNEPYEQLAEALFTLGDPTPEDAKFLSQGLSVFPGNDWVRVAIAAVAQRQGRPAEARNAMQRALLPGSTLNDRQREYATRLQRAFGREELLAELRTAQDRRDAASVVRLADQILAEPLDMPAELQTWLRTMRSAAALEAQR